MKFNILASCFFFLLSNFLLQGKKPNIILILADDLGYGDCAPFNPHSKIKTPHLSKLASEGLSFSDAHAACSTCTPSRYGLLTGINPARTGVLNTLLSKGKPIITEEEKTLAHLFKSQGYITHMLGKWHLGFEGKDKWTDQPLQGGPTDRGFDTFFGIASSAGAAPLCFIEQNQFIGQPTELTTFPKHDHQGKTQWVKSLKSPGFSIQETSPILAKKAVALIEKMAEQKDSPPFFLYYASPIPHQPWVPMEKFRGKSDLGEYADFVLQLDWVVGQINNALVRTRLDRQTILVFTSDNGPSPKSHALMGTKGHSSSAGLRGVKSTRWEGGHRVPLIVKWPDKIPAGKITSSIVNFTDFMATFAELFQVNLLKQFPSAVDSYSFLPALFDERTMMNRPAMVHRSNAIRSGQFKLIHPNHFTKFENTKISEFELYDLDGDRREMNPLSNHRLKNKLFEEYQRFNRQRKFK